MSNIEINATNVKKFSKRLQKQISEKGLKLSLAESHELLAKTLGCNNYDQLLKSISIEKTAPIKIALSTIEKSKGMTFDEADENIRKIIVNIHNLQARKQLEENNTLIFEGFYECLKNLLNVSESGISLCYFQKNGQYQYSLHFETIFQDLQVISTNDIFDDLRSRASVKMNKSGFSERDIQLMDCIERCELFPFSKNKFEVKKFLTAFSEFLNKKYGEKTRHLFKINTDFSSELNKKIIKIDEDYYYEDTIYLKDDIFRRKVLEPLQLKHGVSDHNYMIIKNIDLSLYSSRHDSNYKEYKIYVNFNNPKSALLKQDNLFYV